MEKQLQHITLVDERAINQDLQSLGHFANLLELARREYLNIFPVFDLKKFQKLFETKNFNGDVARQWVNESGVDLRGLKVDVALKIGLLEIPDLKGLYEIISTILERIVALPKGYSLLLRPNFGLLFNSELNCFPTPDRGDTPLYQRVREANTATTENEDEIQFIYEIETYAKLFKKFIGLDLTWEQDRPRRLFAWEKDVEGKEKLYIPPTALTRFREYQQKK